MEQTNRHHRQSEFEAFTAIVRSLQSTSEQLSDDGMKFLNTAAKFYKITPERLKAEIRQHAARSANAAPRIQRSSPKENPKLPENSKARLIADQIRGKLTSRTDAPISSLVKQGSGDELQPAEAALEIGAKPKACDLSATLSSGQDLPTALKLIESRTMKEKRNYLTLASGATVSLHRGNSLAEKLGFSMPNPVPLPQSQIKIKKGLMGDLIPSAKSPHLNSPLSAEMRNDTNLISTADEVAKNASTANQIKISKPAAGEGIQTNKRVSAVLDKVTTSTVIQKPPSPHVVNQRQVELQSKAKRPRIGNFSSANSTIVRPLGSISNVSPMQTTPISTHNAPVTYRMQISGDSQQISSTAEVQRRSPVSSVIIRSSSGVPQNSVSVASAVYCKHGSQNSEEDEEDDSEPEFDTSRFNSNRNPSNTSPLSSSFKGTLPSQMGGKGVPSKSSFSNGLQASWPGSQQSNATPESNTWTLSGDQRLLLNQNSTPIVTSTNFDLTSTLVHPTIPHALNPKPASGGILRGGNLAANQLQEVAGRQLVLSKSTGTRVVQSGNATALSGNYVQHDHPNARSSPGFSSTALTSGSGSERYPLIRPISASQLAAASHSHLNSSATGHVPVGSSSMAVHHQDVPHLPFAASQPKVIQRPISGGGSGKGVTGTTFTVRQQSVSPSAAVVASHEMSLSQQHSLPMSGSVTVNKIDRQLIGGPMSQATLPLQRKPGTTGNVPKAIIQPNTNQGQPLMRNLDARQAVLPKAFIQPNVCHTSSTGDQNVYRVSTGVQRDHSSNNSNIPMSRGTTTGRTVVTTRPFSSSITPGTHQIVGSQQPLPHYYLQTSSTSPSGVQSQQAGSVASSYDGTASAGLSTINPVTLQQLSVSAPAASKQHGQQENTRITLVNVASSSAMISSASTITVKDGPNSRGLMSNQIHFREPSNQLTPAASHAATPSVTIVSTPSVLHSIPSQSLQQQHHFSNNPATSPFYHSSD